MHVPAPGAGLRMAAAATIPLAVGTLLGRPDLGCWAAIGGINVALADSGGAWRTRLLATLAALVLTTISFYAGARMGGYPAISALAAALWGFAVGMAGLFGNSPAAVALPVLIVFVVGLGMDVTPEQALEKSAVIALGGLFGLCLSVMGWPFAPYKPALAATSAAWRALADLLASPTDAARRAVDKAIDDASAVLLASRQSQRGASEVLTGLLVLTRIARAAADRVTFLQEAAAKDEDARAIRPLLAACAGDLAARIAQGGGAVDCSPAALAVEHAGARVGVLRSSLTAGSPDDVANLSGRATVLEGVRHLQADLEAAAGVCQALHEGRAEQAVPEDVPATLARELAAAPRPSGVILANLTPASFMFRHALRLGGALATGVVVYTALQMPHPYWVTLTISAVLKPQLTLSRSRAVQRVMGTLTGCLLALAVLLLLPPWGQVAAVAVLLFISSAWLPKSYTIFSLGLTAAVLLIVHAGTPDAAGLDLALDRLLATFVGAAICFAWAFLTWPSAQRSALHRCVPAALGATACFMKAVLRQYQGHPEEVPSARTRAEVECANAETALERALDEPGQDPSHLSDLLALVTGNRRLFEETLTLSSHASVFTGRHPLPEAAACAEKAIEALEGLGRGTVDLDPAVAPLQERLTDLRARRAAELAAGHVDTELRSTLRDYALVCTEMTRICAEIHGLQAPASRVFTAHRTG